MLLHMDQEHMHLTTSAYIENALTATHSTLNVDRQNRRRSQNDLVITNKDLPVNWQPKASTIGLTSTEEVKLVAAENAITDVMWYANFEIQLLHPAPM